MRPSAPTGWSGVRPWSPLAPRIGYAEAAKLAKEAIATGLTVKELIPKKKLLSPQELKEVLDLRAMTELGVPGGRGPPAGG